jgi:hypothetical protein
MDTVSRCMENDTRINWTYRYIFLLGVVLWSSVCMGPWRIETLFETLVKSSHPAKIHYSIETSSVKKIMKSHVFHLNISHVLASWHTKVTLDIETICMYREKHVSVIVGTLHNTTCDSGDSAWGDCSYDAFLKRFYSPLETK